MKKNAKTLLLLSIVLLSGLLILVGCSDMMDKLGSIDLTIELDTPDVEVASYRLEGSQLNTTNSFLLNNITLPRQTLSNLSKGTWDIIVTAFDDSDNQIGIGANTVELREGQIANTTLLVVFGQNAPQLSSFIIAPPAHHDAAQGTITGTTSRMECKLASASDEAAYAPCSDSATMLVPGTYKIRYAQAHGLEASEDTLVTVPAYQPVRLAVTATNISPSKVYDGTTAAQVLNHGVLSGLGETDQVSVIATATYSDSKAGSGKQITVTYTLDGEDKDYFLAPVANTSLSGEILRKSLTVSYEAAPQPSKTYDGTKTIQLASSGTLNGVVSGDAVSHQATAAYADKNANANKSYTISYTISGEHAGNYSAPQNVIYANGVITKKQLTATVGNYARAYGQANPVFMVEAAGFVNGESASTAAAYVAPTAASIADASTDSGTYSITISEGSAANYSFETSDTGTLTINKAEYDMSAISFSDSTVTYDGNVHTLAISGTLPEGVIVTYDNNSKTNAGTYTVTAHFAEDSANYEAIEDMTASLIINKKSLTASNISVISTKTYDGSASAAITSCDISGIVAGDSVTVVKTAYYDSKQAGTGKSVSLSFALEGTDKDNYTKPSDRVVSTSGQINRKQLTAIGTVYNTAKVYDGIANLQIFQKGSLQGVIEGDFVALATAVGSYASAYAGTGKNYAIVYTLSGADAGNYSVSKVTGTGTIGKAVLTAAVGYYTRAYGQANPAFAVQVTGFVSGESASTLGDYSAPTAYCSANAATGAGTTSAITISGGSAANYSFNTEDTGALTIFKAEYDMSAISFSGSTATYDGNAHSLSVSGTLPAGVSVTYANNGKTNAGSYTVTAQFVGDSANYEAIEDMTADLTISKAEYSMSAVSFSGSTATYDGNAHSLSILGTLPEGVSVTYANNGKTNAGSYTVTAQFAGDSANYEAIDDKTASLTINKKGLTASNISVTHTKTYDGSSSAAITSCDISGIVAGDSVTVSKTAFYDTKRVGTSKPIFLNFTLEGADKDNYIKPSDRIASTGGLITRKQLTVINTVYNTTKVYDGTANLAITSAGTLQGVVEGDSVAAAAVGSYANVNAGSNKAYTIAFTLSGTDSGNYSVSDVIGTGTIEKAVLSTAAGEYHKPYGQPNPSFTVYAEGFVNGESAETALDYVSPTASCGSDTFNEAGYIGAIGIYGGSAANYSFHNYGGILIVDKAVLTVTVGDCTRAYGEANPDFAVVVTGFANGETVTTAIEYSAPTVSCSANNATSAGTISTITISGGSAKNYSFITSDTGTLTITKADYDMSAVSFSGSTVTYDGNVHSLSISGTLPAGVSVTYANNGKTNAGSYEVTAQFAGDSANYNAIEDMTADLAINKAVLIASVGDYSRAYGQTNPAFAVWVTGFVNNENATMSSGYQAPTASCSAGTSSNVGSYTIPISGGSATNYSFNTSDTGTLTITKVAMSGTVSISGTSSYGNVLTADLSNLLNYGTPSYQWNRDSSAISGATGSTYTLGVSDVGKRISATVTAGGNCQGSKTSAQTLITGDKTPNTSTVNVSSAYFPSSPADQMIINLTGLTANASNIEAVYSPDGSALTSGYAALAVDSRGRARILTSSAVTASGKVQLRCKETSTSYPSDYVSVSITQKALAVGDYYAGGIVAYLATPTTGMIAATADIPNADGIIYWSYLNCEYEIGTSTAYGQGKNNTSKIISYLDLHGESSMNYSAKAAHNYIDGSYTDWFLPSWEEMKILYDNRVAIGNFLEGDHAYVTSSESTQYGYTAAANFHEVFFDDRAKSQIVCAKDWGVSIRSVRYF